MHSIRKALALMAVSGAALFGASGVASADGAVANGVAANSPGFLSGNLIQVPVDIPINLCGNSVNVVGALNPAFGNRCSNGEEGVEHGEQHHGLDTDGSAWHQHMGGQDQAGRQEQRGDHNDDCG
ncbi:chaplin [Streptacidiphilus neutrinimicus]|uniref:chaplin n=1 Tax=Streptacidiphilus neutrinimicus TaxID=105420 RepID=UPI0007C6581A